MNKYADEFCATFRELARIYSAEKVWEDVIYACALTQSIFYEIMTRKIVKRLIG